MTWAQNQVVKQDENINRVAEKFTLAFDLDETLVHSYFPERMTPKDFQLLKKLVEYEAHNLPFEKRQFFMIRLDANQFVVTQLRPNVRETLCYLSSQYNLGIFSAGGELYVNAMRQLLFQDNPEYSLQLFPVLPSEYKPSPCMFALHYGNCVAHPVYKFHKPLTAISKACPQLNIDKIILVDNLPSNGCAYPNQLVHVPDFSETPWLTSWNGSSTYKSFDNYLQFQFTFELNRVVEKLSNKHSELEILLQRANSNKFSQTVSRCQSPVMFEYDFKQCPLDSAFLESSDTSIPNYFDTFNSINFEDFDLPNEQDLFKSLSEKDPLTWICHESM